MPECKVCHKSDKLFSKNLGVCYKCIIERPSEAISITNQIHKISRKKYGLPSTIPRDPNGLRCGICSNDCKIPLNGLGYCGLVKNENGKINRLAGTIDKGLLQWYYDPNPTNCVAAFVCPAGTGCGYPDFANKQGPEYGYSNLAVFYGACNFDCLYCQNYQYRQMPQKLNPIISARELASKINEKVSCICYFGGDPSPQMPHAIKTAQIAMNKAKENGQIFRVCFETNGGVNWPLMKKAAELAFNSGGCIKIDLKCFNENLNIALCGVSNKQTLENFKKLGEMVAKRPKIPFLIGSTLLVPGYVDVDEVRKIAQFIKDINPNIPYSLLGFSPHYHMNDLPLTSKYHAQRCLEVAKRGVGLEKVKIGNVHLLSDIKY
ncbi:MAG: radical SAM protein [Candidatus Helarchaeota archaeon]|nr:radical SAM protein [Candidatus Helarchaeota archaeon]